MAGISVFSGRLTIILFLLAGVAFWFKLVAARFDNVTALMSSLLLITTPAIVTLSQAVLSEIPTLTLIVGALFFLERFCRRQTRFDLTGFACCVVFSLYAKQIAVLMIPVYAVYIVWSLGLRELFSKRMLAVAAAVVLLVLPLLPRTLWLSPYNLSVITKGAPPAASSSNVSTAQAPSPSVDPLPAPVPQFVAEPTPTGFIDSFGRYLRRLGGQITLPLVVLAGMATAAGIGRKDASVLLPLVWIILFLVELSAAGDVIPRLAIYTIPPICLLAATLARGGNRALRVVTIGLVVAGGGTRRLCPLASSRSVREGMKRPPGLCWIGRPATPCCSRRDRHGVLRFLRPQARRRSPTRRPAGRQAVDDVADGDSERQGPHRSP